MKAGKLFLSSTVTVVLLLTLVAAAKSYCTVFPGNASGAVTDWKEAMDWLLLLVRALTLFVGLVCAANETKSHWLFTLLCLAGFYCFLSPWAMAAWLALAALVVAIAGGKN